MHFQIVFLALSSLLLGSSASSLFRPDSVDSITDVLPQMTETSPLDIVEMPNGNPYLNISRSESQANSTSLNELKSVLLQIMYSNGYFSGSAGACQAKNGGTTRFSYHYGYSDTPICISAPGTNCMMQSSTKCGFTVCNKASCGAASGTKCTNSRDLQLGEPAPIWQKGGYNYMFATPGTQSIYFDPNSC